jgi:hypothetical protein
MRETKTIIEPPRRQDAKKFRINTEPPRPVLSESKGRQEKVGGNQQERARNHGCFHLCWIAVNENLALPPITCSILLLEVMNMPTRKAKPRKYVHYHKDGTVWARGQTVKGKFSGFWVWFRKDGTKLRSGTFENGKQVGKWTTYDRKGKVYKVTVMKSKNLH